MSCTVPKLTMKPAANMANESTMDRRFMRSLRERAETDAVVTGDCWPSGCGGQDPNIGTVCGAKQIGRPQWGRSAATIADGGAECWCHAATVAVATADHGPVSLSLVSHRAMETAVLLLSAALNFTLTGGVETRFGRHGQERKRGRVGRRRGRLE